MARRAGYHYFVAHGFATRFYRTHDERFFKRGGYNGVAQAATNGRRSMEIGMVVRSSHRHLACFPDGVAFLRKNDDVNQLLSGTGDVSVSTKRCLVSAVDIKTKVAASTLRDAASLLRSDPMFCSSDDHTCQTYIPKENTDQVMQQMTVLNVSFAIYAVASETELLYTVIFKATSAQKEATLTALNRIAEPIVSWAHQDTAELPEFLTPELKHILCNRFGFWTSISSHVLTHEPVVPLEIIKHSIRTFYSKAEEQCGWGNSTALHLSFRNVPP